MDGETKVLVVGATGRIGAETLRALLSAGHRPLALVRAPERAAVLPEGVKHRVCDLADGANLADAFAGVDALLLCSGHAPDMLEHQLNAIAAAQQAGVRRIVKISASPASVFEGTPNVAAANHLQVEAALSRTPAEHTSIRPNAFTQNMVSLSVPIAKGDLPMNTGTEAISWVDARDVGAVAAAALTADGPLPATIEVTGPEALTGDELAGILSEVTGREVSYRALSDDESRGRLRAVGAPEWLVEHVTSIFGLLRDRAGDGVTDAVERWTGRSATPVADALARDARGLGLEVAAPASTRKESAE